MTISSTSWREADVVAYAASSLRGDAQLSAGYGDPDTNRVRYATHRAGIWAVSSISDDGITPALANRDGVEVVVYVGGIGQDELWLATRAVQDGIDTDCDGVRW